MAEDFQFELDIIKMASEHRRALRRGEALLRKKKKQIGIEKYIGSELLADEKTRAIAWKKSEEYRALLEMEAQLYKSNLSNALGDYEAKLKDMPIDEREERLARTLPRMRKGTLRSLKINEKKVEMISCFENILRLIDAKPHAFQVGYGGMVFGDQIALDQYTELEDQLMYLSDEQIRLRLLQTRENQDSEKTLSKLMGLLRRLIWK